MYGITVPTCLLILFVLLLLHCIFAIDLFLLHFSIFSVWSLFVVNVNTDLPIKCINLTSVFLITPYGKHNKVSE